ncbi:MAG: hypothetical protein KGM24_07765, partial [Elusimicrobia bacterium]|nr:hypothetical protein [Elusimicrobiota bacterium]
MSPRALAAAFLLLLAAPLPSRAESFQAWAARAARQEREKEPRQAFESYSNALTVWKPTDGRLARARVYCARAGLRDRRGDEAGALDDYSHCLKTDKKNAKAFARRGELLMKAGRTEDALNDFYKAVALDIRFGRAYADRARAYELRGNKEFAREDYRSACRYGVKSACAKARALEPRALELAVEIAEGRTLHRRVVTIRPERKFHFERAAAGARPQMVVEGELKPDGRAFTLSYMVAVGRPGAGERTFDDASVVEIRRGERLTVYRGGDFRVSLGLAPRGGVFEGGVARPRRGSKNYRLTSELDTPSGRRRSVSLLLPKTGDSSAEGMNSPHAGNYDFSASIMPADGGFNLHIMMSLHPFEMPQMRVVAVNPGEPRTIRLGAGVSATLLVEAPPDDEA